LRDPAQHAAWLAAVRAAAAEGGYDLVINARIDVFLNDMLAGSRRPQRELLGDAVARARAYVAAGVDCVFPIALWEREPLIEFVAEVGAPVNVLAIPPAPSVGELASMGVARISWGTLLHRDFMRRFAETLTELA
jgi:2-methylisocitrate lyase-like PEP mutase family enzyme